MSVENLVISDSYKYTHASQYPPGTTKVYSYLESRGGQYDHTIFFGLQYLLHKLYLACINQEAMQVFCDEHFPPGTKTFLDTLDAKPSILFDKLLIKAVPEGTRVGVNNVLMTIENTDPKYYWLTNFAESLLLHVWYPITVATRSYAIRSIIRKFLDRTGDPAGLCFKLHDFGYRGASSFESASVGGAAHLLSFDGTDNISSSYFINKYYGNGVYIGNPSSLKAYGFSIPATEHSTITSWGQENEAKAYENFLDHNPSGIIACVSDSYDIYRACRDIWGGILKDKVMARKGTLVVRPDSGDPVQVTEEVVKILSEKFGYTTNAKGFKVLHPSIRIIQGDGVNEGSIFDILANYEKLGWSADNIAFGMGGALLQQVNRDTNRFAIKCSYMEVDGVGRDVFKSPITDAHKLSKKGRLKLCKGKSGEFYTVRENEVPEDLDQLQVVYDNGQLKNHQTFEAIRDKVRQ